VGFVGGYYGGSSDELNHSLSGTIDLNHNWNFDPTYAFGGVPGGPAVTTIHDVNPLVGIFYDNYAKIFFDHSNAYGNGYSDALTAVLIQGGPLISVANTYGTNVNAIDITTTLGYSSSGQGGTLTVSDNGGHSIRLTLLGNFGASNFNLSNDGGGHTLVTYTSSLAHPGG
jgi:hypothetical protein